jgi:tetratricopeptide (TPR) repeat protein
LTVCRNSENLLCAFFGADLHYKTKLRATAGILLCVCLLYGVAGFRQLYAALAASSGDLPGLERAVRLEPRSAEYHNALGRMYSFNLRPQGLDHLLIAAELNPHRSRYWMDVASAQRILGSRENVQNRLRSAIAADPTNPAVAWEAANVSIATGEVDRALAFLHSVAEHDLSRRAHALELALRISSDDDLVMREVVPPSSEAYLEFLNIAVREGRVDAAQRAWRKIVQLQHPVDTPQALAYLQLLLDRREAVFAQSAWTDLVGISPSLHAYRQHGDNLIVNGGFELPLLNAAFEWRERNTSDNTVARDRGEHHSGSYSLRVVYDTDGSSDAGAFEQLVSVLPETRYRFSANLKCDDLESATGPSFRIQDYYARSRQLFHSSECRGTRSWHEVSGSFTTASDTRALAIEFQRDSLQLIRGRVWVDDITLEAR